MKQSEKTEFVTSKQTTMHDPSSLNPKEVVSLTSGDDWNTAKTQKTLEAYDKEMDELIVKSKNISKLYEAFTKGNINDIKRARDEAKSSDAADQLLANADGLIDLGESEDANAILKSVRNNYNLISKNRDTSTIRKNARARIEYCNQMVRIFQNMITANNKALGLSMSEAQLLYGALEGSGKERKLAITQIKAAVMKNESKFKKSWGYDFSELGAGKMIVQNSGTGIIEYGSSVDRFLQYCMDNDIVLLAHGSRSTKEHGSEYVDLVEKITKLNIEFKGFDADKFKTVQRFEAKARALRDLITRAELQPKQKAELVKKFNNAIVPIVKKIDLAAGNKADYSQKTATLKELAINQKKVRDVEAREGEEAWVMGTVNTPWGGTYNNIVEFCKAAIKNGYKKIKLLSCNPGHFDLRKIKELQKHPGVRISFSMNTTLVMENVRPDRSCRYDTEILHEGIGSVMRSIAEMIKKAWARIKEAFMKLIKVVRKYGGMFLNKIKSFFKKFGSKARSQKKTRHIKIDPNSGKVTDYETINSEQAMKDQAKNVEDTAKVMERMMKLQDMAFKSFLETIDDLEREGKETLNRLYSEAAAALEAACGMNTLTGGIVVEDEEPSKDYLKEYPSFA